MESLSAAHPYTRKERRLLVGVLIVVALVHLASFLYLSDLSAHNPQVPPYPIVVSDSVYYTTLADNLLAHHVYSATPDLAPTRAAPPGYPFFLAVVKGATGSFTPASLLQTLLALLAVTLVYAIGRRFLPWWLALLAALAYGIEPMVVYTDTTLLTDGLFSSLFIITIYLGFFQSKLRGVSRAAVLGVLLGVAAMIRPTGEYLVPIFIVLYAAREWLRVPKEREDKHPFIALFVLIFIVAAIIVPWMVRNQRLFGVYEIDHEGQHAILDYDVRDFLAWRQLEQTHPTSVFYPARHTNDPVFDVVDKETAAQEASITPPGANPDNYTEATGMHFIFADPVAYSYFHLANTIPFFLGGSISTYEQIAAQERNNTALTPSIMYAVENALTVRQPGQLGGTLLFLTPILLEIVWWLAIVFLALLGIFFERRRFETWLFATIVTFFALITGPISVARYRIPVEPYLFLLAALGACALATRLRALPNMRAKAAKIFRYLIAGGTTFLVSLGTYSFLVYVAGMWYLTASIIAFLFAFVVSFVLQKFFTFRDSSPARQGQQIFRYLFVLLFNISANTLMLFFFVSYLGIGRFSALVIANVFIAIWNYFIYQRLIFTEVEPLAFAHARTKRDSLADLSVIIPCYNEEGSIGNVIDTVPKGVAEIIVVDNNSSDATARIAQERGAQVVKETRQGYGAAAKRGFASAHTDLLAVVDGDNQHPAEELPQMVNMLLENDLDFISATRFPLPERAPMSLLRHVGNWDLTLAANILFGVSLTDSQCGMVVFKRSLLPKVEPKSADVVFVQELKIRAQRDPGIRFAEYHIACIPRLTGVSKVFPVRHGVKLLAALIRLRLTE